jgi:hypothetical protein
VVCCGAIWCAVVCAGVLWCAVVCCGAIWCAVVCVGVLGCAVVCWCVCLYLFSCCCRKGEYDSDLNDSDEVYDFVVDEGCGPDVSNSDEK